MSGPIIHRSGTNHPPGGGGPVNGSITVDEAQALSRRAVEIETRRVGCRDMARDRVADCLGCAPGTLENAARGRLKRIEHWLVMGLRALVARELEREIGALEHELMVLRAGAADPRGAALGEVAAHLDAARKAMEGLK